MGVFSIILFALFICTSIQGKSLIEDDPSNDLIVNKKMKLNDERPSDDLETAAGTNVLRPLFVYRQQLASRERLRKAGARRLFVGPQQI